jgi:pimeloyl-ACP methyl ester carboxylesterase
MSYSTRHYAASKKYRIQADRSFVRGRAPWLIGTGIALATMAMFVQYRTRQAEQENPPDGRFIEVDGVRLHYAERGQGQAVVLLHGNGTLAQEWQISGLLDLASDKCRVIAFDRPGYGYSERPRTTTWDPVAQAQLLYQALQALGVEQPVVVGHSWGSMVAVALGLEHPEYVRSLVLLSGYYYPTPRLDVPLFSAPAIPVLGDLMRHTISPLIGRAIWPLMMRKLFGPARTTARFKNEFPVWMALRPSQLRASAAETGLMIPSAYKLSARYRELHMPVVIMSGASDRHVIAKLHSERLHQELPQSELILVPEVGHMIQHLVPEQVMAAIDKATRVNPPKLMAPSPAPVEAV